MSQLRLTYEQRQLADRLNTVIKSRKRFFSGGFGAEIALRLGEKRITEFYDLTQCSALVTKQQYPVVLRETEYMTEKQAQRAWNLLVAEGHVEPDPRATTPEKFAAMFYPKLSDVFTREEKINRLARAVGVSKRQATAWADEYDATGGIA